MKFLKLHVTAFLGALLLFILFVWLFAYIPRASIEIEQQLVVGSPTAHKGKYSNALKGDSVEIDLIGSIKTQNQITLFGSSEFNSSKYATYNFFPDSLGISTLGYGHAYHQSLSILIELLVAHEYLEGSKVVIFLSPDWFEVDGSNIEAFIEFARPHFLNKILFDSTISNQYKTHIGKFIDKYYNDIDGVSASMDAYRDLYLSSKSIGLDRFNLWIKESLIPNRKQTKTRYKFVDIEQLNRDRYQVNFKKLQEQLQFDFLEQVSTNDIYVKDDYFIEYIQTQDRSYRKGILKKLDTSNNEYADFKLLLKLLKEKKVEASFIMQGLNPFFYQDMGKNDEFYHDIVDLIAEYNMPCLNLYVSDTGKYEPAMLSDVMHLGDYGWMRVNEFIYQTYYE